jgi:hypothetical protein
MRNEFSTRKALSPGDISSRFNDELTNAEPSMNVTEFGITIRVKFENANADSSIRCKCELDSNDVDQFIDCVTRKMTFVDFMS